MKNKSNSKISQNLKDRADKVGYHVDMAVMMAQFAKSAVDRYIATLPADWHSDSSIETWFPGDRVIDALKAAYARGHNCDLGDKCPGCMAGYALEELTGREWTQEECE